MVGIVEDCVPNESGYTVYCTQRNRFFSGDTVELLSPKTRPVVMQINAVQNADGEYIESVNHAQMPFSFHSDIPFPKGTYIRKNMEE